MKGIFFLQLGEFAKNMTNGLYGERKAIPNPKYPKEGYEEFISRMIEEKKVRIQSILDV